MGCVMCGCGESDLVYEGVVICRCGLVYRNEVGRVVYLRENWGDGEAWDVHFREVEKSLRGIVGGDIIEIGPGLGWLAGLFSGFRSYVMIESSVTVARYLRREFPCVRVIGDTWEGAVVEGDSADLVLCCGVDYLFSDLRRGMEKISRVLRDTGYLYIERNVFLETEAYAWNVVSTKGDLFGSNAAITTWFSYEQYRDFLGLFFEIVGSWSYILGEVKGRKVKIHGFLCRKSFKLPHYGVCSWREHNMELLGRL
jgi:SAM-dependent methyltransferase